MMTKWEPGLSVLICAVVLTGIVAGGVVQRRFDVGPSGGESLQLAADALSRPLPARAGSWVLLTESKLGPEVVKMLRCPAYINRVYAHEQTGDRITVAVLVGPAGPIAVHTPEICYSSHDYKQASLRQMRTITD